MILGANLGGALITYVFALFSMVEPVNALEQEKALGKAGKTARSSPPR